MGVAGSILKPQPCSFNKKNVFLIDVQMLLVLFFDIPNQKSVNREKPILSFSFRQPVVHFRHPNGQSGQLVV